MKPASRIAVEISDLRNKIRQHDYHYYSRAEPEISDYDYDMLMRKLGDMESDHPELVTTDSPTQRVSGQLLRGFKTLQHSRPMLSLTNCYTVDELNEFDVRLRKLYPDKIEYVCELKIDGVAVSLSYHDHMLAQGTTRGDGLSGDDITANIRTIKTIPLTVPQELPSDFEVRGEIFYPIKLFAEMNRQREADGLKRFMNPRNGAAGTLKMLDTAEVARRPLSFFAYELSTSQIQLGTHTEVLELLVKGLFNVDQNSTLFDTISEVEDYWRKWDGEHSHLPYETDGIVVKLNRLVGREMLGSTAKSPRWAIAFKYSPTNTITRLQDVIWQVGRTGAVTPVALLEPVLLMGTMISRASLHNWDEIKRLDIRIGDRVELKKGGDIIPKVVSIVDEDRPPAKRAPAKPEQCPSCGTEFEIDKSEVVLRCRNWHCPAQITERIIHFASRGALNIDGLGAKTIELLVDQKVIVDAGDLYTLNRDKLREIPRQAELSTENIILGIRKSAAMPFGRVVFGLGIRHVGSGSARLLAARYRSFEELKAAPIEELESIDEIGPTIAKSVNQFFRDSINIDLISKLDKAGVGKESGSTERLAQTLDGISFVLTGTLDKFTREEAAELIRSRGGKVTSTVGRKTSFLLTGANPGSKVDKAKKAGLKIIDETAFELLINTEN